MFISGGIGLIVVVNAILLLGVGYNRKLPAESEMLLTERELAPSPTWYRPGEDSGLNLRLNVRPVASGEASWLTLKKLKSLGFPVSASWDAEQDRRHNEKQLPKDVYVVLELNGPSYQAELDAALSRATRDEALANGTPANEALAEHARSSRQMAEITGHDESRLYCIDAGLDPETLRRMYPDRAKFAVVLGTIQTAVYGQAGKWKLAGQFMGVRNGQINVPLGFRRVFGDASPPIAGKAAHYEVSVAWGRRLEPWIVGASARSN
jgi:hypothetical protein